MPGTSGTVRGMRQFHRRSHPCACPGEEGILVFAHEQEGSGHVVVLHRADIIVQQGQRVTRLDEEVIVDAVVLVVVDDGGKVAGEELGQENVLTLEAGSISNP